MMVARSYLFLGFMATATVVMGLVLAPVLLFGERAARPVIKFWSRLILGALRVICGVSVRIEAADEMPKGGFIVAANHQSMWETIALYAYLRNPVTVFKKELLNIPVYGWWARASGIMLDRSAGPKAIRLLRTEAQRRIALGEQIIIFPEGTRGPPHSLLPLLPGVAAMYLAADAPVTPAVHNSGSYWRYPGNIKNPGVITLRFLPAIAPGLSRREFLARLETTLRTGVASLPDA